MKAGAALGSRARGEGFSWDFCPHSSLTRGEEDQQEVPTELFFPTHLCLQRNQGRKRSGVGPTIEQQLRLNHVGFE